jgi:hypothetical protein
MHAPIDDNSGNDRGEMVGDGFCGWREIGVCVVRREWWCLLLLWGEEWERLVFFPYS